MKKFSRKQKEIIAIIIITVFFITSLLLDACLLHPFSWIISKNEDMFYETISHFCSTHKYFEVKRNVSFKEIFSDDPVLSKSQKEFDIVLYEVKWPIPPKPKIVIEINGGDHFGNRGREKNDIEKIEICKKKKIGHITIDNSFVKSYEYIRDIIIGSKNKRATQLTLDELMFFE